MNQANEPQNNGYGPLASLAIITLTVVLVVGALCALISLLGL